MQYFDRSPPQECVGCLHTTVALLLYVLFFVNMFSVQYIQET